MDSNPLQIEYDSSTQTLTLTTPMNHQVIIRESSAIHSLSKTPTKTSSPYWRLGKNIPQSLLPQKELMDHPLALQNSHFSHNRLTLFGVCQPPLRRLGFPSSM
ncbi:MAG: hypothetical protein AB7U80_04580 [Wolinella sp.]